MVMKKPSKEYIIKMMQNRSYNGCLNESQWNYIAEYIIEDFNEWLAEKECADGRT